MQYEIVIHRCDIKLFFCSYEGFDEDILCCLSFDHMQASPWFRLPARSILALSHFCKVSSGHKEIHPLFDRHARGLASGRHISSRPSMYGLPRSMPP